MACAHRRCTLICYVIRTQLAFRFDRAGLETRGGEGLACQPAADGDEGTTNPWVAISIGGAGDEMMKIPGCRERKTPRLMLDCGYS